MGRDFWNTLYIRYIDVVFKPVVIELLILVTTLVKAARASFLANGSIFLVGYRVFFLINCIFDNLRWSHYSRTFYVCGWDESEFQIFTAVQWLYSFFCWVFSSREYGQ